VTPGFLPSRDALAMWPRALLTSYLVTGLMLACLVTVFDHHGAERNPGHRHSTATSKPMPEHEHGFEVPHLHGSPFAHAHRGAPAEVAGELWVTPGSPNAAAGNAALTFVDPAPLETSGTSVLSTVGAPSLLEAASLAVLTWAAALRGVMRPHQTLFAPPLRPPALSIP
jgi:hypothetical protein